MSSRIPFFFIVLLCAALGAALGILISSSALMRSSVPIPIEETSSFRERQEVRMGSAVPDIDAVEDSLLPLFSSKPKEGAWFSPSQASGVAVALTADGLVMSSSKPAAATVGLINRMIVGVRPVTPSPAKIRVDNKHDLFLYTITPMVPGASSPQVKAVTFAPFETLQRGQEVFAMHQGGVLSFHHITTKGDRVTPPAARSSEDMAITYLSIDGTPEAGLPLFAAGGALVGFTGSNGDILLGETIGGMVKHYLKEGILAPTVFGVQGIDISSLGNSTRSLPPGFLIQGTSGTRGVTAKSPAEIAGIKEGDLLLSFDGRRLNGAIPLQVLLQRYPAGAEVPVLLLRENRELTLKVTLGSK